MVINRLILSLVVLYTVKCQLINSLIGQITSDSFEFRAFASTPGSIKLILNNQTLIESLQHTSDSSANFYKSSFSNLNSLLKEDNVLDIYFNNVKQPEASKKFKTFKKNLNYSMIVTSYSRGNDRNFYNKVPFYNPDLVLFLGDLIEYTPNMSYNDIQNSYLNALKSPYLTSITNKYPFEYYRNNICGEESTEGKCSQTVLNNIDQLYYSSFPVNENPDSAINKRYYSIQKAGFMFLMTDSRSYFNKIKGTIFGETQTDWIINQIKIFEESSTLKGLIIGITQPYYYNSTTYEDDLVKQDYVGMNSEAFKNDKLRIAEALKNVNFKNPNATNFKSVVMLSGGNMLAFDKGSNNPYGGFPIVTCGPMDGSIDCLGGPFSHGYSIDKDAQFCHFNSNIDDKGNLCFYIQGYIAQKEGKSDVKTFTYNTCFPEKYNSNFDMKCPIIWKEKLIHVAIVIAIAIFIFVLFYVIIYKVAVNTLDYQVINKEE